MHRGRMNIPECHEGAGRPTEGDEAIVLCAGVVGRVKVGDEIPPETQEPVPSVQVGLCDRHRRILDRGTRASRSASPSPKSPGRQSEEGFQR